MGGGCAAMAAAYELTRPAHQGCFELTVYQQGWRLGGKGASGRGPCGRIEEHGLHVWMGFYENAFRLMRSVYDELGRDPARCRIATWRDAFFPASHVGLASWTESTDWTVWSAMFPPLPGVPGDPLGDGPGNPFTVLGYLVRSVEMMRTLLRVAYGPLPPADERASHGGRTRGELLDLAAELTRTGLGSAEVLLAAIDDRLDLLQAILRASAPGQVASAGVGLLAGLLPLLRRLRLPAGADAEHRARAAEVLELLVVGDIGTLRAGVLAGSEGFDALDDLDFADWLRQHGASEQAVCSPFLRGLYSLMFAYEDGDCTRPRAAAGQALRGCLRMFFTYREAFFWKMRSGMGDIVFAPLYEVLQRRGVRFAFFHRLLDVQLGGGDGDRHVRALRFGVQAEPAGDAYQPLVDVGGLPCWPAEPDWSQLRDGREHQTRERHFESAWDESYVRERELVVGEDFDFVVLAVGLGEVPRVCRQLVAEDPRWAAMVAGMKTVATQALQLWTQPAMPELGWARGPITMTAFTSPFDTWADMTHLVGEEAWGAPSPGAIGYFCNVLDERQLAAAGPERADFPERAARVVAQNAEIFVDRDLPWLWPHLRDEAGRLRWEVLVDWRERAGAAPAEGPERLVSQHLSTNVDPTDRYVMCLPGTPRLRISPLDRTYDNFTVAGDWTSCGLNLGCVEAAVMSGLLAAHALSGAPSLASIVGYDHP